MEDISRAQKPGIGIKLSAVFLFLIFGGIIMVVFSPWRPLLDFYQDILGRIALTALLGGFLYPFKRIAKLNPLLPILSALFVMIITVSAMYFTALFWGSNGRLTGSNPRGYALFKLNDMVVAFVVIIGLSRLLGFRPRDLYLQKGKMGLGLLLGFGTFALAAATAIPSGIWLFKLDPAGLAGWKSWLPWLLLFVLANGAMEELLFRGLFLKKFEPLLGEFFSIFTIGIVFTALHFGVSYTSDQLLFQGILLGLALLFGTVIQKTKSLWPAILFHAGMDISVMLGIFSNLR